MKRVLFTITLLIAGMVAMPESASAQFDLSKIGGLFGGSSSSKQTTTSTSPLKALAENAPTKSEILGTWKYSDLELEYIGVNSFAEAAIGQVQGVAREELRKSGVTPGCFTITLLKSGNGTLTYEDYTLAGSYTYDSTKARFELTATASDGKSIKCGGFLKKVNGKLVVMFEAEGAIKALQTILPEQSVNDAQTFEMINGVVQSFPGIYISMHYTK